MEELTISPEDLQCATLRGDWAPWPIDVDLRFKTGFLESSTYQGIQALLYHQLKSWSRWTTWPLDVRDKLRQTAKTQSGLELLRRQELIKVLEALANVAIRPVLMKGTPLAYTHYPLPALRTRGDTDFLIRPTDLKITCQILEHLGYQRFNAVSGELVSYQFCYSKQDKFGASHVLDVHWRISNRQGFAQTLTYEELFAESVAVPALGEQTRALGPVHALLLACMHRVAHMHAPYYIGDTPHYGGNRLIWLYDIHLLMMALSDQEWIRFAALAEDKRLRQICLDGLSHTKQALNTPIPRAMMDRLTVPSGSSEHSAAYLHTSRWRNRVANFRALPSWRERIVLLKEYAFPPSDYMLNKYRTKNRMLLPILYLRRATTGIGKLFQ